MIKTIAHISDIHIRKSPTRNDEYEKVFNNLITLLTEKKPDRIVITGDLVHENLSLQPEQLILVSKFLNRLALIAPVRITRGNHDYQKSNSKRTDSVEAIVSIINNSNINYYNKTGFYVDENIVWAVWHHGEKNNNPWKSKEAKEIIANKTAKGYTTIDLFHDPISGCKSTTGFEMKSGSYYKVGDFKADFLMAGDIHKQQYLNKDKTKAYAGSLISQDISEGDDSFHGLLLWNMVNKAVEEIPIENDHSFKNVNITQFIDFDDLDFEIDNPTKYMTIRFIWSTLPLTRIKDNERKLIEYTKNKYPDSKCLHKNNFIEIDKVDVGENVTLENVSNKFVQHEIFKEFLTKIGTEESVIDDVIALDLEILSEITVDEDISVEWNIIKFGTNNFMSYEKMNIDWRDIDGLFQIAGKNKGGKTTIFKSLSYILFGKTLETETRIKFGDSRFVNDKNNATYCDGYAVIEGNGEYYGVKRKTEIIKNKSGEITSVPTTLNYYLLNDPDDAMNEENSLEILDEDRRVKTQKKIESVIGNYDNFNRIVYTTSDTLNRILSNDMAVFIDSLLFDSGLDIFDKKLEGFKIYQKKNNEKQRVTCNVESTTLQNNTLGDDIVKLTEEISNIETIKLPDVQKRIETGRAYVETLTKKMFKIDLEIYNLNVPNTKEDISIHNENIVNLNARMKVLSDSIVILKESYDEKRLSELITIKDAHKTNEYASKLAIKEWEKKISDVSHEIEIINGKIFTLKKDGVDKKNKISELKESKTCPTCKQILLPEHQKHIDESVGIIEKSMFDVAKEINIHLATIETKKNTTTEYTIEINKIKTDIETKGFEMETILIEIGDLTNDKNDVDKRKELQNELNQIPIKMQNDELKIGLLQQKIDNYDNSLRQIEENKKIEIGIAAAKNKISQLELEETDEREEVYIRKTVIGDKQLKIKNNNILVSEFKTQEYNDLVMSLYKKCVHRDGIPRQMLSNYIIPKINVTLENMLSMASFKVWLDVDDLRPKLAQNNFPNSIIDCISSCGMERTFSSIVLKFALNQINVKAKPAMFLLDEVIGKLDDDSVEEFNEILQIIKNKMKKVLIVEHVRDVNPDHIFRVVLSDEGISTITID